MENLGESLSQSRGSVVRVSLFGMIRQHHPPKSLAARSGTSRIKLSSKSGFVTSQSLLPSKTASISRRAGMIETEQATTTEPDPTITATDNLSIARRYLEAI